MAYLRSLPYNLTFILEPKLRVLTILPLAMRYLNQQWASRSGLAVCALSILSAAALEAPAWGQTNVQRVKVGDGTAFYRNIEVRHGTFVLEMDDFAGGPGLSYRRNYSTDNYRVGIFGKGWGSTFETMLVPMPDNTVTVVEDGRWSPRGAGQFTVYGRATPETFRQGVLDILNKEYKGVLSSSALMNGQIYYNHPEIVGFRADKVQTLNVGSGLSNGTILDIAWGPAGHECNTAKVMVTPVSYIREDCDGLRYWFERTQTTSPFYFKLRGWLNRVDNTRTDEVLSLSYIGGLRSATLMPSSGSAPTGSGRNNTKLKAKKVEITEKDDEKIVVSSVEGGASQVMKYGFDENKRLIRTVSPAGVITTYTYDTGLNGYLTEVKRGDVFLYRISYSDGKMSVVTPEGTTLYTWSRTTPKTAEAKVVFVPLKGPSKTVIFEMDDDA